MSGVTELAVLRLASGITIATPSLRTHLCRAKQVMESALGVSNRRFTYYQQVEDPSVLYIIGDWKSPEEHVNEFIPSAPNQELLQLLKDEINDVEMYHVDVPNSEVPAESEVISIVWHQVRGEDKDGFEERWQESKGPLSEYAIKCGGEKMKPAWGWRVEKAGGKEQDEEWVVFCGWKSVKEHEDFAKTQSYPRYGRIRQLIKGYEVKHGKRVDFTETLQEPPRSVVSECFSNKDILWAKREGGAGGD